MIWINSGVQSQMGKVKLFLWLTEPHAMKGYWAVLTSALDGGEWSASQSGCFTSRERAPSTRWIGAWFGPRAILDTVAKRKILKPAGIRSPDHAARIPALYHWANPAPWVNWYEHIRRMEPWIS
jgi:hypothetical protein